MEGYDPDLEVNKIKAIFDLSAEIKSIDFTMRDLKKKSDVLKEEVRGIMAELDKKKVSNEEWTVSISYTEKIDPGYVRMKYPELAERFIKEEPYKGIRDIVDKKGFKAAYPKHYKASLVEGITPRLTIKHLKVITSEELLK